MLTAFDKAILAVLPGIITFINQKWGFKIDASPETLTIVVGFVSSILVYFAPNKAA